MTTTNITYLLLGGNQGDRRHNLTTAVTKIATLGMIEERSSLYESAAWGKTDQADFYNMAIKLRTSLVPLELLERIKTIEQSMGRSKTDRWHERSIDIDILIYGHDKIELPTLVIPHPHLPFRKFALLPLAEIAPTLMHPVLEKTVFELLNECTDDLRVEKVGKS